MKPDLPELDETVVERISKNDLVPITNPNHRHVLVRDTDDETDDYYAEMCTVQGCGLGRLVAKDSGQ